MAANMSSPFLTRLMPELRLKVYEYVVCYDRNTPLTLVPGYLSKRVTTDCKPPALLLVNKQIRDEMIPLLTSDFFYRNNTFKIVQLDIIHQSNLIYGTTPGRALSPPRGVAIESTNLGPIFNLLEDINQFSRYAPNVEELTVTFDRSALLINATIALSRACTPDPFHSDQEEGFLPPLFLSIAVLTPCASVVETNPAGYSNYDPALDAIISVSSQAGLDDLVNRSNMPTRRVPLLTSPALKKVTLVGRIPDFCIPIIEGYRCGLGNGHWVKTLTSHNKDEPAVDLTGTNVTYVWSAPSIEPTP
ncbi:hypothetical protein H2204_011216 [Knufia peltigerae]|uniref:Uncharacterized protein n=1 Tax=Knufia peltigerae TaxID=1002370 RepID=A0AA38XUZ0_9EURO|nr:hypothetical protein H2204_011216 [Knufia peltigerae]